MRQRQQTGFTYLALLFAVAFAGIAMAATGILWSVERQRLREQELLFVGNQFREAISHYYASSPGMEKEYPRTLNDLIEDRRFLGVKRHLRKIYPDPLTGKPTWGMITAPQGGIMGVYSLANGQPIKTGGFKGCDELFAGQNSYAGWRFVFRPVAVVPESSP